MGVELLLHLLHSSHLLVLSSRVREVKGLVSLMCSSSQCLHVCGGGGEDARARLDRGSGQMWGGVAVRGRASLAGGRQGVATQDRGGRGHDAIDGGEVTLVGVGHTGRDGLLPGVLHEKLLRFLGRSIGDYTLHGLVHLDAFIIAWRLLGSTHVLHVWMRHSSSLHHLLQVRMRHGEVMSVHVAVPFILGRHVVLVLPLDTGPPVFGQRGHSSVDHGHGRGRVHVAVHWRSFNGLRAFLGARFVHLHLVFCGCHIRRQHGLRYLGLRCGWNMLL